MISVAPLQSLQAPWVHLHITENGEHDDNVSIDIPGFRVFTVDGQRCETKTSLLSEYARTCDFPSYFGNNWDALEECLSDLEWIPATGYVTIIRNGERVLYGKEDEFSTFVEILQEIGQGWSRPRQEALPQSSLPFHTLFLVSRDRYRDRPDWKLPILCPPTP